MGVIRRLKNSTWEGTYRHTNKHCDLKTESDQCDNSVKISETSENFQKADVEKGMTVIQRLCEIVVEFFLVAILPGQPIFLGILPVFSGNLV